MARFGTVEVDVVVDVKHEIVLGTTPDGEAQIWLLYRPEPWAPDSIDERQMSLWMRRCDVFSSRERAVAHLDALLGEPVAWQKYDPIFPELWVGVNERGHRWWLVPAPVDPMPGGQPS